MLAQREIKETIRRHKPELRKRYGVSSLGLFGSYARGEQRQGSDIDILVEFRTPIGLLKFGQLERTLGQLLGTKVDLVMKRALKPRIGEHILREVVPL